MYTLAHTHTLIYSYLKQTAMIKTMAGIVLVMAVANVAEV